MQNKFYVWSEGIYLGSVRELNPKTAVQKAKLIARYNRKASFQVSTSSVPGLAVFATGLTEVNKINKEHPMARIMKLLTQRAM